MTVTCGSGFVPARINELAFTRDDVGILAPITSAAVDDVFEQCARHQNIERLVAIALIAAAIAALLIKRTGRGYRNPAHYRARILLASAARRTA